MSVCELMNTVMFSSWGTDWGEGGFGRVVYGINMCSISGWATAISIG